MKAAIYCECIERRGTAPSVLYWEGVCVCVCMHTSLQFRGDERGLRAFGGCPLGRMLPQTPALIDTEEIFSGFLRPL